MLTRCSKLPLVLAALSIAALGVDRLCAQDASRHSKTRLILLDGSAMTVGSLEIEEEKLRGDGVPADSTLDDVQRIELLDEGVSEPDNPAALVELRLGGRVRATSVTIAKEKCQVQWRGGKPLSIAIDFVRAVLFDVVTKSSEFEKALTAPSAELDRVFIKGDDGNLSSVTGLIESFDGDRLKLEVSGRRQEVPSSRLYGFVIAQPVKSKTPPKCVVSFRNGSVLGGDTLSVIGDKASLHLPGGKAEFSWQAAARVSIRSSRMAFLSDLKPTAEEQQPLVTLPQAAQRDKSVSGGMLTLGTQTFEKGLGVHARSSLTFAAEKKWDTLAATIGLDAAAGGKGDCIFVVAADGQPLLSRRMKATDPPADIELPITGCEKVTLSVEPGEGLDLADHADWCDVRFIKASR